jgi:hypothetical protein
MKKFKLIVLAIVLVASMIPCSVSAASTPINVTIDGVAVQWTDATPYVDANNRTMVPLRAIGEAMGLDVEWDKTDKSATFAIAYDEKDAVSWGEVIDTDNDSKADSFMGGSGVVFTLDEKMAVSAILFYKLGADLTTAEPTYTEAGVINMDTAAVMKDNRTYAPVKYLAEFYGYTVNWDQNTRTVILTSSAE